MRTIRRTDVSYRSERRQVRFWLRLKCRCPRFNPQWVGGHRW